MDEMLNILVGCLAFACAYGALITWSRQRVFTAARGAERYDHSRANWAGNGSSRHPRSANDELYY